MAEISEKMKTDTWDFFVESKSRDPTHKIPGCENLIENLIAATKLIGTHEYDDILQKCAVWADRAHHFYYTEHDHYEAIRHCNAILREITHIIYEPQGRFANMKSGSFKYTSDVKKDV